MTEIKLPYEDCTREEAIDFLRQHIEARDAEIARLKALYDDANETAQKRAWAMDRAVKIVENTCEVENLYKIADIIFAYVEIQKPSP